MSTFKINGSCVFNFYGRVDAGYNYDIPREYEEEEEEVTVEEGDEGAAAAPAEEGVPVEPQQDRVRDMRRVFSNGDVIRHKENITGDAWFGYYRSEDNCIVANGIKYRSLSGLCKAHYSRIRPERSPNTNGWTACEVLRDGVWVNCNSL